MSVFGSWMDDQIRNGNDSSGTYLYNSLALAASETPSTCDNATVEATGAMAQPAHRPGRCQRSWLWRGVNLIVCRRPDCSSNDLCASTVSNNTEHGQGRAGTPLAGSWSWENVQYNTA